jgi:hypothetical protein
MREVALQVVREKGKRYNNANEKWSMLSCFGRVVLKKEREDHKACERQPTLFAEVPTRRGILRIAIRKEKKPLCSKLWKETGTPRHAFAEKGKRKMCREAGNNAQDTSIEVGKTS